MNKYVKGFIAGLILLAITFSVTVLIMGSIRGNNFVDEIKSWFEKAPEVADQTEALIHMIK